MPVYDVLGIGFGPANLALAIALQEESQKPSSEPRQFLSAFLERQREFGWHRDMLLDDATMQVSFLKDLATLRNPQSQFTFVNYLNQRGRLEEFINFQSFYPLRLEFHDYLSWAAEHFQQQVDYHEEVTGIEPQLEAGKLQGFIVRSRDNNVRRTKHLVIAAGLSPSMPEGISSGERMWHTSQLLTRLNEWEASFPEPRSIAVIGGGQSAAEVIALLHQRFNNTDIHSIQSRFGFAPSDSSPFVNRIFDHEGVRLFHESSDEVRSKLFEEHRNTNYSVVDEDLILQLYRLSYSERINGTQQRLHFHSLSRVVAAEQRENNVKLQIRDLADQINRDLEVDLAIFATGYRPVDPSALLGTDSDICARDAKGRIEIDSHYRLQLRVPGDATIYVQGAAEHTHGLGSTLLSNVASRARVIANALLIQS